MRRGLVVLIVLLGALAGLLRLRSPKQSATSPITALSNGQRRAEMARLMVRRGFDRSMTKARQKLAADGSRRRLQADLERREAEDVVAALGEMKGALMKLGQMASYLDEGMPPAMSRALASLRADAPPMPSDLALTEIERSLRRPLHEVFTEIDPEPIAAASIGQVHRAVTSEGKAVAVKVQYPGIARAIASDLDNSEALARLLGMVYPGLRPDELVAELRARISEELDYRHEAANQKLFADYYRGHPHIWVPDVDPDRSTDRVLTTEFVPGRPFESVYDESDEVKERVAEVVYRFVFRSLNRLYVFNGDPHPGNYLLADDGRVAFVDFGLVKHFEPTEVEQFARLIRAMIRRDPAAFRRTAEEVNVLGADAPFGDEEIFGWFAAYYEMILEDAPMTFTSGYSSALLRQTFDAKTHAILKHTNVPPTFALIQRINLGLFSILGKLGARANWRRISEELWEWTDAPPSTPTGHDEAVWLAGKSLSAP
ncbi:MAG: AarF/ABC1/UbiB kinase family protein [Acidimicrobiaceae bacterium]|nr:AarF/ABC1/UbiB kinase family protein [Acidimicrobiaceae bacterium]